jgi:hypothetical protein
MEMFLNLAWAALAFLTACLWLRLEIRSGSQRRQSLIALALFIFILFPVISMSDDLWSIQNPAETDSCQRRDHLAKCPHFVVPPPAALPAAIVGAVSGTNQFPPIRLDPQIRVIVISALGNILNRPPPSA